MGKKKKPAGVGGQRLCLVTKRYMRGNVMVEKTWIERRKVLNARKQNVAKPGEEKKEVLLTCSTEHFALDHNQHFGAFE